MNTYSKGGSKVGVAVGDEQFRSNLWKLGFRIVEMKGDGSCFFHCLVHGLKELKLSVEKLRKMVHDEVQGNRDQYSGKFEGQCGRTSEEEMDWIMETSHWADHMDIYILAVALHCKIVIHQDGLIVPVEVEDEDFKASKVINVSRHNNHYNLLQHRGNDNDEEASVENKITRKRRKPTSANQKNESNGSNRKLYEDENDDEAPVENKSTRMVIKPTSGNKKQGVKGRKIKQEDEFTVSPNEEELSEVEIEDDEMDVCSDGTAKEEEESETKNDDWIVVMKGNGSSSAYQAIEKAVFEAPSVRSQRFFVKYMLQNNIQKYADLMNVTNMEEFMQQVDRITLTSTSATSLELVVLAELFQIEIHIHSKDGQTDDLKGITNSSKTVHLYRRDNGIYDLVERKNKKCKSKKSGKGWYKSFIKGCSYSDEKFENVKQHIEEVHGERAYQCLDCKGKVIRDINEHETSCHSPNKTCSLCSKQFTNHKALRMHIAHYHRAHLGISEPLKPVEDVPAMNLVEVMRQLYVGQQQKIFEKNGYIIMYDEQFGRTCFCFTSLTNQTQKTKVKLNFCNSYSNEPGYTNYIEESIHWLGYECGHLISKEDMRFDEKAVIDSMNMLNISPMTERLNCGKWSALERHVRKVAVLCNRVHYFSIPVYGNESRRKRTSGGVYLDVPEFFAKLIFYEKPGEKLMSQAFLFKNEDEMRHRSTITSNAVSNEELLKATGMEFINVQQTWSKERIIYVCPKWNCRKNFVSEEQFNSHKDEHNDEIYCCICTKAFKDSEEFKEHLKDHATYKCQYDNCDMEFRSQTFLKYHEAVHTGSKKRRYACTYTGCSTTCKSPAELKVHMLIHSNERLFFCDYEGCVKGFYTRQTLKRHKLTHKAPQLECKYCNFKTRRKEHLKKHYCAKHIKLEIDDLFTSKYFPGRKKLWKYECDKCDIKFTQKSDWIYHCEQNHEEKKYVCDVIGCGKEFRTRTSLIKHKGRSCPPKHPRRK